MATEADFKRKAIALMLATALAVPAEGLRQWVLRKTKGSMFGPTSLQAASDEDDVHVQRLCPSSNTSRIAIYGDQPVDATVSLLCFLIRPNAIGFVVTGIVVKALNGATGRRLAHVSQEIGKVAPLVADRDTPTTIVGPLLAVLVGASLNYSVPSVVRSGIRSAVGSTLFGHYFSGETTATFGLSRIEILGRGDGCIAAFANTVPSFSCPQRNRRKASKHSANGHRMPTRRIAGRTAKKTVLCGETRAGKADATTNTGFGNNYHKSSTKITQVF